MNQGFCITSDETNLKLYWRVLYEKQDSMKKTFTLLEIMISVVIIWFLVVLIFRIYSQVANISIRIENEKILNTQMLSFFQTMQTIGENYKIDFDRYQDSLVDSSWLTRVIYLTWSKGPISIYATWDCTENIDNLQQNNCWIQMNSSWTLLDITDKWVVYFTKLYFKIIPFKDTSKYNVAFDKIYHNWFAVYMESYIKKYNEKFRPFNVKSNYTNFFNLRQY